MARKKPNNSELAHAVSAYLSYKAAIGLKKTLSEASLAVPISEYLYSKHGILKAEEPHPLMLGEAANSARLDFVVTKSNDNTWHPAYECKFGSPTKYNVFKDLWRLACLRDCDAGRNANKYFIYATASKILEEFLKQQAYQGIFPKGKKSVGESSVVDLEMVLSQTEMDHTKRQARRFSLSIPQKMRLVLDGWSSTNDYRCGVWKVSALQNTLYIED